MPAGELESYCRETRMTPSEPVRAAGPATWAGKGLFVLALIFALKLAQPLLLPVVIAVILTFVLATPVRMLRRRLGVPEVLGALLLVAALLGGTGLMVSMLAGPAAAWWQRAPSTLSQLVAQFDRLRSTIPFLAPPSSQSTPATAPVTRSARNAPAAPQPPAPPVDPVKEKIASEGLALTGVVLQRMLSFAVSAAATVILLYFLLASEHWMLSRTVEAIPRYRARALMLSGVRCAQRDIGHYLAALGVINLGVGTATGLALTALDMPNPVLWGSIAAVLNFIPYIGPLMMAGLLLLVGIVTFSTADLMVAPVAAFLLIHAVEANFLTPWFVGRRLALSPVSVFLSVMFFGWLWGIAGALVAVPILIGTRSLCKRNRRWRLLGVYLEGDRKEPPSLRSLLRRKRRLVMLRAGEAVRMPAPANPAAGVTPSRPGAPLRGPLPTAPPAAPEAPDADTLTPTLSP